MKDSIIYNGTKDDKLLFAVEISGQKQEVEIPVTHRSAIFFDEYINRSPIFFDGYKKKANVHCLIFVSEPNGPNNSRAVFEVPIDEITAKSVMAILQRYAPPRSRLVERRNEEE